MKNKLFGTLVAILGALLMASIAAAAPVGASITSGTASSLTPATAQSVNANGGNVQEVNVTGYTITDKWAGFFGQVSGNVELGDSAGHIFYKWTVNDPTGSIVYAAVNDSNVDWTNISALYGNDAILPSFLTTGADSFNNTFTQQAASLTVGTTTISNVNYTTTWDNSTGTPGQGTVFKTYALKDGTNKDMIFAAEAVNNTAGFNGNAVDYQVLVGLTSQTSSVPVYFYLQLP